MKKNTVWVIALVLVAAGAFVMAYGVHWLIDAIGALLLLAGAGVVTYVILKNKDKEKRWIYSLVCALLGVIILAVAGLVRFEGVLILALVGAILVVACRYIEFKRQK